MLLNFREGQLLEEPQDHETILNILLQNPEELNLKEKPSGIRENKMFTLDMREIPISSAEADDNGAYLSKGSAKRLFQYNSEGSRTVHKNENGVFYANVKTSKGYKKEYIPESEVYELTRYYRTSKFNPEFSRTIATVKAITDRELKPFYLVLYKWAAGESKEFFLPRHGNAKKPTSSSYFRKDPRTFTAIDNLLEEGMPTDKVYNTLIQEKTATVSETITDPKMIENRKYKNMKATSSETTLNHSEPETLIRSLQTLPLNSSVTFTKEQYISVNSSPNMLNDIYRFCVLGNSILRIDTTFELVDGLWLTDTTYTNESLINESKKHPEFPGPSFWHFKKSRESYRRFAGELAIAKPELLGLKKIGHDLDKAIANGMTDIFRDATNVWCTQHSQERDALKLKSLCTNERSRNRIMADIYGSQHDVLLENGLADAEDPEDFQIKLASLETVWESLAPGFHLWFTKHRYFYIYTKLFNTFVVN